MEKITSVNNQLIKDLFSLQQKKARLTQNKFLIEGLHLVEEAYKTNNLEIVLSTDETLLSNFKNTKNILVNDLIINKLSTTKNPQNIIGVSPIKENKYTEADQYVVLDGINDPGNLGTIIRTSLALGVNNLILSNNTVDVYNEKVVRATQGAIFKANIYYTDLKEIYTKLKQENIKIITTSLNAKKTLNEIEKIEKFALVVGNEANGISEVSIKNQDETIIIPIKNDIESLNVAVATSIVLYTLLNK